MGLTVLMCLLANGHRGMSISQLTCSSLIYLSREWNLSASKTNDIVQLVQNFTRLNSLRRPELWNSTTFALQNYNEAENILAQWSTLSTLSQSIHDSLPSEQAQASFYQLVNHPIQASANLAGMYIAAGMSELRASQARLSANMWADQAVDMFEGDFDFEEGYHSLLGGKWDQLSCFLPPFFFLLTSDTHALV